MTSKQAVIRTLAEKVRMFKLQFMSWRSQPLKAEMLVGRRAGRGRRGGRGRWLVAGRSEGMREGWEWEVGVWGRGTRWSAEVKEGESRNRKIMKNSKIKSFERKKEKREKRERWRKRGERGRSWEAERKTLLLSRFLARNPNSRLNMFNDISEDVIHSR
ncbi:MAG: hypothetical protein ACKERG_00100 [Candidatus Hodgkinia cicadicola]